MEWKLEVWDWFFSSPQSDMKSQSIMRDGCICLLLYLLGFNKTSLKRDSCATSCRGIHCLSFAVKQDCSHPRNVFLSLSGSSSRNSPPLTLRNSPKGRSGKSERDNKRGAWCSWSDTALRASWPSLGGCQTHGCKPCNWGLHLRSWNLGLLRDLLCVNGCRQLCPHLQKPCP